MICIGMSMETLKKYKQYDGLFNVFTDMKGFYEKAYTYNTDILVITDEFISEFIGWDKLDDTVSLILKTRQKLEIVILGEHIKYTPDNVYILKDKWNMPSHISNIIAKLHTRQKNIVNNKEAVNLRDFKLNSQHIDDFMIYALANPEMSMQFLRKLLDSYTTDSVERWALSNQNANLSLENSTLYDKIKNQQIKLNQLQSNYNKLAYKYDNLIKRINYQYSIPYEDKGNEGFYPDILNYKKILYIKEISHVKYTNSLIYYLQNILNSISKRHTRCVVIEAPGTYKRVSTYTGPDGKLLYKPHYDLTTFDLNTADIIMVGYHKDIMQPILQNIVDNQILIIWDKTGSDKFFVNNNEIIYLYTFSDLNDNRFYNVKLSNILSYSTSTKYIPIIHNFEDLSTTEKMKEYSNLDVIQELIKALEV